MIRIKSKSFDKVKDCIYSKTFTILGEFTILEVMILIVIAVIFGFVIIRFL